MLKTSDFTECYVIELNWCGSMKESTVRVKITQKNVYKKYLENLKDHCIVYDYRTGFVYTYHANVIKGQHNEYTRFIYCEEFVDAYRVINYYREHALRLISMVGYSKQHAELGFDNLAAVDFGKEKINVDDYLQ